MPSSQISLPTRESNQANASMRLAVFGLVGALFSDPAQTSISPHNGKLFLRACDIIRDSFRNLDFGPSESATEMESPYVVARPLCRTMPVGMD
jgi:hypothetical protein